MSASSAKQLLKKGQTIWAHVFNMIAIELDVKEIESAYINLVLKRFFDVFVKPIPPSQEGP